jgi:hypothetical protein
MMLCNVNSIFMNKEISVPYITSNLDSETDLKPRNKQSDGYPKSFSYSNHTAFTMNAPSKF